MKILIIPTLFVLLLTGCTTITPQANASQTPPPQSNPTGVPAGATALANPQVVTVKPPMVPIEPDQGTPGVSSGVTLPSKPHIITVRPPLLPVGPGQGTPGFPAPTLSLPQGWQMFNSTTLGVALNYPSDWSVSETNPGVKFASPQGVIINLELVRSNRNSIMVGLDCTDLTNSYGQSGTICSDDATHSYRAMFTKNAGASTGWLLLSTISQEKPTVFLQMFDSVHFLP